MNQTIQLIEIYQSIQGETTFSGLPTTFIRTAACNLRCVWCDTSYSFGRGKPWNIKNILETVNNLGSRHVCLTGGEPLLQKEIHPLMQALCDAGYRVSLETGGSLSIEHTDPRVSVILDIKCPGSEMEGKNRWKNLESLKDGDEIKFVLANRKDYDYARSICKQYSLFDKSQEILYSPVHGKLNPQELIAWILEDQLPVRLNLQIHKYIWDENTKGV